MEVVRAHTESFQYDFMREPSKSTMVQYLQYADNNSMPIKYGSRPTANKIAAELVAAPGVNIKAPSRLISGSNDEHAIEHKNKRILQLLKQMHTVDSPSVLSEIRTLFAEPADKSGAPMG